MNYSHSPISRYALATLSIICFTCAGAFGNISPHDQPKKTQELVFALDTFNIGTGKVNSFTLGNYSSYAVSGDTVFLVFEDLTESGLIRVNLETDAVYVDKFPQKIHLEKRHSFLFLTALNYKLLRNDGKLYSFTNGSLVDSVNLNEIPGLKVSGMSVESMLGDNNAPYIANNLLYFPVHQDPFNEGTYSNRDYDYPMTGVLNLTTGDFKFAGPMFPKLLVKNDFGLLSKGSQHYTDTSIFYMIEGSPLIQEYKIQSDTTVNHCCRSKYQTTEILPINFKRSPKNKDQLYEHMLYSASYQKLVYNPSKQHFYRFFLHPMEKKDSTGKFTTFKDKQISLLVLNRNLQIIDEFMLPRDCFFIFTAAPAENGLLINYGPLQNKENNSIKMGNIRYY